MSEDCHSILKAYCVLTNKTISEVLYDWARQEIQTHALHCTAISQLYKNKNIKLDPRVNKPCWGYRCNLCVHEKACRVAKEDKLFIMDPKWHSFLNPSSEYVKDFDGGSVDCCTPDQLFDKLNYESKK